MARKPRLDGNNLYAVAIYLARPEVHTEIHAELPEPHQRRFEEEYYKATKGYPLPNPATKTGGPYYIWPPGANKQGRELRIYFKPSSPEPPIIGTLTDSGKKWHARKDKNRFNHSNLVMQLFECGFVLGANQNYNRINTFMQERFPVG